MQITAQVPAADITTAGIYQITVQSSSSGGRTSSIEQFEVDTGGISA
jgi:hypothetical protein